MRIAYFTDTFIPEINGVTNTLNQLKHYLAASSHDYMFFAPEYGSELDDNDPHIHRFKSIPFPLYSECRLSIPIYPLLSKKVEEFAPDIIHIVTPIGIGNAGVRYAKENNIPLVSSFHTNLDAYLKYYNLQHFEKYLWMFFKKFHDQFITNFCPSTDTMRTLEQQGIGDLEIWARGIDTDRFKPQYKDKAFFNQYRPAVADDIITYLYIGRLAAEKDIDILMESMTILNERHRDKIELILVGDGPARAELEASAPENVTFTGFLKGDALATAYASADVFAFASSTETLGNVVLEAMASGLPVVAVRSGGIVDNVMDGYNGLLAEPRNSMSFSLAMQHFITDPGLVSRLRKQALDYAKTKTWTAVFNKLMADYLEAIMKHDGTTFDKSA